MATTKLSSKMLKARTPCAPTRRLPRAKPPALAAIPGRPATPPAPTRRPPASFSSKSRSAAGCRLLRQRLQLTATELAAEAGLSPGMLSKIENGGTSPSLSTLKALARALNVPMTSFFADFEERRDCSYVRAGQGVLIERRGTKSGHRYELLGHSLSGDIVVEPYLITLSEDAEPYVLFQHDGVEFIYMLIGKGDLPPRRQALSDVGGRRAVLRRRRAAWS